MKKGIFVICLIGLMLVIGTIGCFEEESNGKKENGIENGNENGNGENDVSTQLNVTINPFLWRIEGETPSYLYGTIHLNKETILTLPDVVYQYIVSSDVVFTEIPMDWENIVNSVIGSMLPFGQTVDNILPDVVLQKLNNFLLEKKISEQNVSVIKSLKVWAIASNVMMYSDSSIEDDTQPSLDHYIWNIATQNNIEAYGLETVEEQLNIFDSLTIDEQIEYLNYSLDYVLELENQGEYYVDIYKNEYLTGDLNSIIDLEYSDFDENNPLHAKLLKMLLTDRNQNMTSRIMENITNNPDKQFFFAIGVAHFADENSIISLLENQGYEISRVSFDETESCENDKININGRCYVPYLDEYKLEFT